MINLGYKQLKSGPLLVYSQDESKNQTYMEIIINYGGELKRFKVDGEEYTIKEGLAHLLEHVMCEDNIYGNMLNNMKEEYFEFNASTSRLQTTYYINVVYDFYKHLEELIKLVNIKSFTKENLDNIKKPILEEIKRGLDHPHRKLHEAIRQNIRTHKAFKNCLGTVEDVKNMDYELISKVHDVFYQPSNQIIYISGNFNLNKTIKLIENIYKEINKEKIEYEVLDKKETLDVNKKEEHIIDKEFDELINISYKIDISKLSSKEKVKLTFYLSHFLKYNFSDESEAFKIIQKEKLSIYSIDTGYSFINKDILQVDFTLVGTNLKRFKEIIENVIKNIPYDEEYFKLWKNEVIMQIISRESNPNSAGFALLDNIIAFEYYEKDTIEDIDKFSIEDYLELIKRLEFNNYIVVTQTKE